MVRYTYAAWHGTPESAPLSPEALLDALTDTFLQHGDLQAAMRTFLRHADAASDTAQRLPGAPEPCQHLQPHQSPPLPPEAEDLWPRAHQQLPPPQPLQQLETLLLQADFIRRTADGLRLTPKGARHIGARALHAILRLVPRNGRGDHAATRHGRPGALTGETKAYAFGDTFDVHLGQTLLHALLRRPCLPLRLEPQDFVVQCREQLSHSATVIMLDMSASMELFGRNRFTAAKKMALALAQLIATRFPHDALYIVGFGDTARQIHTHDLPYVTVGREHTNTQAGLRLARTLLRRVRTAQKHIVLITDGRPTAIYRDGQLQRYTRGLHPVILEETYKEAKRCREQAITLNTVMVADEEPLIAFVRRLTAICQGRALYTTPERLGQYVLEDYLRRR